MPDSCNKPFTCHLFPVVMTHTEMFSHACTCSGDIRWRKEKRSAGTITTLFVMCRNLGEHAQHTQNPPKKKKRVLASVTSIHKAVSALQQEGGKNHFVLFFFGSCISSCSYVLWRSCRTETVWCSALQLKTAFRQQWHHFHNATQRSSSKTLTALLLYLRNKSGTHHQQQLLVRSKHVMHAPKNYNITHIYNSTILGTMNDGWKQIWNIHTNYNIYIYYICFFILQNAHKETPICTGKALHIYTSASLS